MFAQACSDMHLPQRQKIASQFCTIFWITYSDTYTMSLKQKKKEKNQDREKQKFRAALSHVILRWTFFPHRLTCDCEKKKKIKKHYSRVSLKLEGKEKKIQNLLYFWSLSTIKWYYFLIFRIFSPIWLRSLRANRSPLRSTCLQSTNDSSKQNFMLINTTFLLLTINAKEKFRG